MATDNVGLLREIAGKTKTIETNQDKIFTALDKKVDKEEDADHRRILCEKIADAKKIAIGKRSKAECQRMFDQLKQQREEDRAEFSEFKEKMEEERKESKSDKWMYMATLLSIIALIVSALGVYYKI